MAGASPHQRPGKTAGLVVVLGWFLLFCAAISFLDAGWRAWKAHGQARWIETPARIRQCSLDVDYPFARDGGGVVYLLRCRLSYQFAARPYEFDLHTRSNRSARSRSTIDTWIGQNGPGTVLLT